MAHKRNRHFYVQHHDLLNSTILHLRIHFLLFSSTVLTTSVAHLAGPTAMGGAAQKLDDIVAPSPISRLFSRNNKVTWGYLARKVTTICCKWRVVKCLYTRSVGLGRRHSQVRIGRRKCNCLQKQAPFHEYHSRRRDGLLWSNTG